jgi:hypothetical protein
MRRHLLRTTAGSIVLVLCVISLPGQALAQTAAGGALGAGVFNDPFTFYYAIYLPNQQLQSMRPSPNDSIDNAMATRQYYAQTDRRGLYNPISPYADQNYDPLHPYSRQQGTERVARPYRYARDPSNLDGTGPSLYYGRATQYFPTLRAGRGRNANVYARGSASRPSGNYTGRGAGGGGGGGGMGGMGGGMGGMGGMM